MIKYKIRQNWRDFADSAVGDEALNGRTIANGRKSQVVGLMGEMVFGRYLIDNQLDFQYLAMESTDFDFRVDSLFIDVKTAHSNYEPQPDWHCRIPTYQEFQRTDIYVFAGVSDYDATLWGWITKDRFWSDEVSWLQEKGSMDKKIQLAENRMMNISDLNSMEDLITLLAHQGDAN